MPRKLTITLDDRVYDELHRVVGRRHISRFIQTLVRPHVVGAELDAAYREMAADRDREAQAEAWEEMAFQDFGDEAW